MVNVPGPDTVTSCGSRGNPTSSNREYIVTTSSTGYSKATVSSMEKRRVKLKG